LLLASVYAQGAFGIVRQATPVEQSLEKRQERIQQPSDGCGMMQPGVLSKQQPIATASVLSLGDGNLVRRREGRWFGFCYRWYWR
jgi:hypothetical protein